MLRFALLLSLAVVVTTGCNRHKDEVIEPGGPPPLPPASGTAVGYLVDAAADLQLSTEQIDKLKKIDDSLAAQNGSIDVQIRQIEQPVPAEELSPQQMKAGVKEQRYDNAPGKSNVQTADSQRLHKMHADNESAALKKALALLDAKQLEKAKRILQDRGVDVPGEQKQEAPASSDDGQPLPGMDQ